ncbi:MAG: hypothetical protein GW913_03630 [Myxococcales bacterium]|nr:hypothetical protein [Myxococcales bacterium]
MLDDARVSAELWSAAHERRRIEYRICLEGLRRAPGFDARLRSLEIHLDGQALHLRGFEADGSVLAELEIARSDLSALTREYLEIVELLGERQEAVGLSRMEALDMAKKVVHDRGGRLLLRRCRPLGFDLDSARRLFSVWVALSVDTTRLGAAFTH